MSRVEGGDITEGTTAGGGGRKVLIYIVVALVIVGLGIFLLIFFRPRAQDDPTCLNACGTHPFQGGGQFRNYPTFAGACQAAGGTTQGTPFGEANFACTCRCTSAPQSDFIAPDGTLYQPSVQGQGALSNIRTCLPTSEAALNPDVIEFPDGTTPDPLKMVVPRGSLCDQQPLRIPGKWNSNLNRVNQVVGYDALDNPYGICPFTSSLSGYREAINLVHTAASDVTEIGTLVTTLGTASALTCADIVNDADLCNSSYVAAAGVGGNFYYGCTQTGQGCAIGNQCFLGDYTTACEADEDPLTGNSPCKNMVITSDAAGFLLALTVTWEVGVTTGTQVIVSFYPAGDGCAASGCGATATVGEACTETISKVGASSVSTCTLRCVGLPEGNEFATREFDVQVRGKTINQEVSLVTTSTGVEARTIDDVVEVFQLASSVQAIVDGGGRIVDGLVLCAMSVSAT